MAEPLYVDSPTRWSSEADDLLELLGRRPSWHARAACRGRTDVNFFPERGESMDEARAICATCAVQPQCLEFGRTERVGCWGGLSERERRRERRRAA